MTRHQTLAGRAATLELAPLHAVGARAAVTDAGGDLTLEACVVPWGVSARVTDDGRTHYTESWSPGSLTPDDRVVIYDGHVPGRLDRDGRQPIGRADSFEERPDGLYATLTLANTARGRDVYELARTLGYVHTSLEAQVPAGGAGTVARTSAAPCLLTGVAVVLPPGNGAYAGAIAAARADTPEEPDPDDPDDPEDPDAEPALGSRAEVVELVRGELARLPIGRRAAARARHPLAAFADMTALVTAARTSAAGADLSRQFADAYAWHRNVEAASRSTVGRAWVDQVTVDNPGVIPPNWITQVFGILDRGRPAVMALGGPRSPGPSGMDVNWPYFDGDLSQLVAEQAAEKTAIASVKVSFKKGTADLATYAGGSDVSFQLARRSSPSYMALYDRILQIAYGMVTEAAFIAAVVAAAGGTPVPIDVTDDTGGAVKGALFAASAQVRTATGVPATAVLAASDVYAALGAAPWLVPPQYGTMNVTGVASAATLQINVSGLQIVEVPTMAAGEAIVTNEEAAAWFEEGPYLATADDVQKLGTDVAIWGMGAPAPFLPKGIVPLQATLPPPITGRAATASSGRTSAK